MEFDVQNEERNELLDRDELELSINHSGESTPSKDDVRTKLAAERDLDPTTIQIDHIYSSRGLDTSTAQVKIFDEPVLDEEDIGGDEADEDAEDESGGREVDVDVETEDEESDESEDESAEEAENEDSDEDTEE